MSDEKFVLNTGDKLLAAISEKEYVRDPNHKYIVFTEKPPKGFISQAATILMDFYLPSLKQSLSKWQKDKKLYGVTTSSKFDISRAINNLTIVIDTITSLSVPFLGDILNLEIFKRSSVVLIAYIKEMTFLSSPEHSNSAVYSINCL